MADVQKSGGVNFPLADRKRLLISAGEAVEEAMKEAVRSVLLAHKRAGNSIASWEDGEVVIIPAEEIEVEETPADSGESRKD